MLFNSYTFLFAFLPVALLGFYLVSRLGRRAAAGWLILASFTFYGWWNPQFVILLVLSIVLNYSASEVIAACKNRPSLQAGCLTVAIAANVGALVYYKYLAVMVHALTGLGVIHAATPNIILPLGISFFTFTQIGYLVDRKQDLVKDRGVLDYVLFVTFFPHLIAGPILHNREIMPQFSDTATYRFSGENLAVGLSIFVIGLAKKCLLADPISTSIGPGFSNVAHLPALAAWNVALSYSLQLYFDFSGYSDMAIGLARMFNIRFPLNFNSPYKATSIIDLWQRWHITLSRYLALYLYSPISLAVARWRSKRGMGINREAQSKLGGFAAMVMFPTMVTMGLAGMWHGAGVTFLIFGLLHGSYLTINHAYRIFWPHTKKAADERPLVRGFNILLTYGAVVLSLIFFRAPSVQAAAQLISGMIGLHGVESLTFPAPFLGLLGRAGAILQNHGVIVGVSRIDFMGQALHFAWLILLFVIIWGMPNTQQIMRRFTPALGRIQPGPFDAYSWRPSRGWAVAIGVVASIGVLAIGGTGEFLYFQF
jgi:alginate O-acetyltransferase complex protein AlgI